MYLFILGESLKSSNIQLQILFLATLLPTRDGSSSPEGCTQVEVAVETAANSSQVSVEAGP